MKIQYFYGLSTWISYNEPALTQFKLPFLESDEVRVLVRREDQNHPFVSGNKWWKLKYNLLHAIRQGYDSVLTFGGAYSNHIYSTAAACHELGVPCIGIIRGEKVENNTVEFARQRGMNLQFISREEYRRKSLEEFLKTLKAKYGNCFIIPEGGTNEHAVRGCEELGNKILDTPFDYMLLAVGTGGTIAGVINSFEGKRKIIGIPVLKNGGFLQHNIPQLLKHPHNNWTLYLDYHHGGYAKSTAELEACIYQLQKLGMPAEFVYTGKLFWATADLIRKKIIEPGATVLLLHSGGLRTH